MISKNTICLWYDGTALDAAKFSAETYPNSAVMQAGKIDVAAIEAAWRG